MWKRRSVRSARAREDFVLDALRAVLDASRTSSEAVIAALARALRGGEPAIDAVLAFIPSGNELACVFADGARVEHYASARLRRDASSLAAQAAIAGHRASGTTGTLVPTDRCALAVPMQDANGVRAVFYLSSSSVEAFDDVEPLVRTIEHAAAPYAIAVEREAARADATYDGLTGLLTPRAFRSRLREEIARARLRNGAIVTLWFIDTDHFKAVNDGYGHAAGDAVLQQIAELLRMHVVPEIDVAGRNGGDEFCALLRDGQKTHAIERAQAFCDAVRRASFGVPLPITASIGVASFPHDAAEANALLEAADAAMYHSKHAGRDRVAFAAGGAEFAVFRRTANG
jgi:diguanylate cyclase (GGDEF)-like protein